MSTKQQTTPSHEYAAIFPLNEGPPLWELSDRIKANGLREPIVLLDGQVLDGRRRELACLRAGVAPKYRKFGSRKEDGQDPLEFVIDVNLHRRHLGEGDRALAAARYATARGGKPSQFATVKTRAEAAEKFEVSKDTVDRAKTVIANGTPALQAAVAADEITVSDAAKVAKEPAEVQDKAVSAKRSGKVRTLKEAVEKEKAGADPLDSAGKQIPSDLADVFAVAPEFQACITQLNAVSRKVDELAETDAGKKLTPKGIRNDLNNAKNAIRFAKPYAVCPYCKSRKKCEACKGLRWLDEQQYKLVPEDVR